MAFMGLTGHRLATARIFFILMPAFLLFGFNQSSLNGVLDFPSFVKHFPLINTSTTTGATKTQNAKVQGTVSAIYTLGCLIGALSVTQLGNRFGRRKSLIISSVVAAIGLLLEATSFGLAQLIVGRIIAGIGNGGVNAVVPVWQSEVTKPKSRGKNVVLIGTFIAIGIAAISWVVFGLSFVKDNEVAWRLPVALPIIFCLMLMAFTMSFPESPRWLISKGRLEEAREALVILAGKDHANLEAIDIEITAISNVLGESTGSERGFSAFFKRDPQRLFYRLCLAIAINFCAQLTGSNVITYYGTTIFKESLGLAPEKASLLNAGVLTWKIVAALFAYFTVDRFGRRPLFMASGLGMGISMAGLAGTVWAIDNSPSHAHSSSIAATFFTFLFMTFFPLGFLGANFLYAAEIAPQDLRIYLAAVGTATHWLFNFVSVEITPVAIVTIRWRYYIVYATIGCSVAVMVYFLFPETKGRSLEEMDTLFSEPDHWWQVPAYARVMKRSALADLENEESLKTAQVVEHVEDNVP